jgi:hypothetical protein
VRPLRRGRPPDRPGPHAARASAPSRRDGAVPGIRPGLEPGDVFI